jgi:hypothetical protein
MHHKVYNTTMHHKVYKSRSVIIVIVWVIGVGATTS